MAISVINLDTPIVYCFNMRQYVMKMDVIDPSLPRTPAILDSNVGPYSIAMRVESMYATPISPGKLEAMDQPRWWNKTGKPSWSWDDTSSTLNMFGYRDQLNFLMSDLHFHQNADWDAMGEAALRIAVTIVNQFGFVQKHEIYLVPTFVTFNPIDDHTRDMICMITPHPVTDVTGKPPGRLEPEPDFHASSVVTHLNFDGPDQWSLFFDSTYKVWTSQGRAQTSVTQTKFGSSAGLFEMGSYLETVSDPSFAMGSFDFTYEAWVYPRSFDTQMHIVGSYDDPINFAMSLQYRRLNFYDGSTWHRTTDIHFDINNWYFVTVTRSNGTIHLFVDGKLVDSFQSTGSMTCNKKVIVAGGPNFTFDGYIDELRITRGICRYDSDFSLPKTEFSYPRGVPPLGGAEFYGKGELLYPANMDYQFGFGDFSIEAWVSPKDNDSYQVIMSSGRMSQFEPNSSWEFASNDQNGHVAFYAKAYSISTPIVYGNSLTPSVWSHVAVTRENGLTRLFINGKIVNTSQISYDVSGAAQVMRIGAAEGRRYFNGRLDAIRIGKGKAYYRREFNTSSLAEVGAFDPWVVFLHNFNNNVLQWKDSTGKYAERVINVTTGPGSYPYIRPERGGYTLDKNYKRKFVPWAKSWKDTVWFHLATLDLPSIQLITTNFRRIKRHFDPVNVAANQLSRINPCSLRSWRDMQIIVRGCRSRESNWLLPYIPTYQCHNSFGWDGDNVNHHTYLQTCNQTSLGDRNFRTTWVTPHRMTSSRVDWSVLPWVRISAHPDGVDFHAVKYSCHNDGYLSIIHRYTTSFYEQNTDKSTKTPLNRANKVITSDLWSHNVVFMLKKPCFSSEVKHLTSSHLCFTHMNWNSGIQQGKTRISTPRPSTQMFNLASNHCPDISSIWKRSGGAVMSNPTKTSYDFQKAKPVKFCGYINTKDGGRLPFGRVSGGVTRIANKRTGRTH